MANSDGALKGAVYLLYLRCWQCSQNNLPLHRFTQLLRTLQHVCQACEPFHCQCYSYYTQERNDGRGPLQKQSINCKQTTKTQQNMWVKFVFMLLASTVSLALCYCAAKLLNKMQPEKDTLNTPNLSSARLLVLQRHILSNLLQVSENTCSLFIPNLLMKTDLVYILFLF